MAISSTTNTNVSSPSFEALAARLDMLELWLELAVRPSRESCPLEDLDMLDNEVDDLAELKQRCHKARKMMNSNLPPPALVRDEDLIAKESSIIGAGLGLFYQPKVSEPTREGEILCYYTGHYHNMHSSQALTDKNYLMLVSGDLLIDAGPCLHIKARFINDPLNEESINCEFVPQAGQKRVAVVTKRIIQPGEELFAGYGEAYWSQQRCQGRIHKVVPPLSVCTTTSQVAVIPTAGAA